MAGALQGVRTICTARSFDDGIARSDMENDACRVHDVLPNIA